MLFLTSYAQPTISFMPNRKKAIKKEARQLLMYVKILITYLMYKLDFFA
nr:MAG TPA: hypothetical protein [Caudoviricetes sp.]